MTPHPNSHLLLFLFQTLQNLWLGYLSLPVNPQLPPEQILLLEIHKKWFQKRVKKITSSFSNRINYISKGSRPTALRKCQCESILKLDPNDFF